MSEMDNGTAQPTVGAPSSDERTLALLTHLSGILLGFIVPLVIWLVHKDKADKPFVVDQAKEALNFQITLLMGWVAAMVLSFILIGFLLYPVLFIANIVFCILAGLKANEGVSYRYPVAVRLIN